jgi:nanoRNase/pAp phosphatase (c-di-AMP/oligoRNAs hydrolase)
MQLVGPRRAVVDWKPAPARAGLAGAHRRTWRRPELFRELGSMQIITTHKNTDFDGLAAVIAALILFPESQAVVPKTRNPNVKAFLSIHKDLFEVCTPADIDLAQVEQLIVVDAGSWSRLERMEALKGRDDLDIRLYDHHTEAKGGIRARWRCVEKVGATTTLLVRELEAERKLLTPIQATLLLAGIYEDTGNLTFPATTAQDARAAAWLLERKADLAILNNFLKPAYSERHKEILFQILQHARRTRIRGNRVSINKVNVEGHLDSLAVVMRMALEILNVDAVFGIFFEPARNCSTVIARSQNDAIDVGAVMRGMGGGGHPRAGSAQIRDAHPDALEQWILELVRGSQRSSVQISDLMSFPVQTVAPGSPMEEVAMILRTRGVTGIPVVEAGRIVGMISRRDFRRLRKDSQLKSPVKAYMTSEVLTIAPGLSPTQAAQLMVKHDIGRLPVVADGRLIGIITRSDLMRFFYDLLPD